MWNSWLPMRCYGVAQNGNAHLLGEVAEHPHVVVAGEEGNGQARVGQLGQLALQAAEAPRNGVAVLKPEVENVAQQVDGRRVAGRLSSQRTMRRSRSSELAASGAPRWKSEAKYTRLPGGRPNQAGSGVVIK